MKRLKFDSSGRLAGVDLGEEEEFEEQGELKTSQELEFLKETKVSDNVRDGEYWSLYAGDRKLEPIKFSNGKTQEDVVREIVQAMGMGNKIIFLHGVCGTGKSAIALNIARALGRAAIVVPVKGLQRQYEEDYMGKKYLLKKNGERMKIAMITGRENHDSVIRPGVSCADPTLPDTIPIAEKNYALLKEYYDENPLIKNKAEAPTIKMMKRISVAPSNPYWSPIIPADVENMPLWDAKKKKYRGLNGRDFIFYHRKAGCSYFDQYLAYLDADIIIFNSAKYKIEVALDKKPETDVDIIDEADEFLDNFSNQKELNLTRLLNSFKQISPERYDAQKDLETITECLKLEERNKGALGIDEDKIYKLEETQLAKIFTVLLEDKELQAEMSIDEMNYSYRLIEIARNFDKFLNDTYATFYRMGEDLHVNLVTTNLSKRFEEIINKTKTVVFMSGTLHSQEVLKHVFGIKNFKIIEAETLQQGNVEIVRTGKEFDCRYSNFGTDKYSRKDYLKALNACMEKAKKPTLVHVNAFEDLPTEQEVKDNWLSGMMSKEKLRELQSEDKTGRLVSLFKSKLSNTLFTTKCSRGVDFPGDICNSMIFTKYPNPNINGIFWKILKMTHPNYFWEFYRDKARREFLQRVYRAIRSKDDHVYVLSPDSRVLDAVREMQMQGMKKI